MSKLKTLIKARYLRKTETEPEKILWDNLRNNKIGVKFRRQHPIDMYILDFYSPKNKIGIELDGRHHLKNKSYDQERNNYLKSKDIKILRFWNNEIINDLDKVLDVIKKHCSPLQ